MKKFEVWLLEFQKQSINQSNKLEDITLKGKRPKREAVILEDMKRRFSEHWRTFCWASVHKNKKNKYYKTRLSINLLHRVVCFDLFIFNICKQYIVKEGSWSKNIYSLKSVVTFACSIFQYSRPSILGAIFNKIADIYRFKSSISKCCFGDYSNEAAINWWNIKN